MFNLPHGENSFNKSSHYGEATQHDTTVGDDDETTGQSRPTEDVLLWSFYINISNHTERRHSSLKAICMGGFTKYLSNDFW